MRPISPPPQFHALAFAAVALAALAGCKPIDQRSFDPNADRPPVVHIPPGPPAKIVPPFLQVQAGTPRAEWQPVVTRAAHLALARKPGALFIVTALQPDNTTPAAQTQGLDKIASTDGRAIADAIIAAGARPLQVQLVARTSPGAPARVQVDVR